jgi:hypothetical protein
VEEATQAKATVEPEKKTADPEDKIVEPEAGLGEDGQY